MGILEHVTYTRIIIFLVLTGCGMPIPEEVPIIAAGVASAQGLLTPLWAFLACVVGALLGDTVMYSIGYYFGHNLMKRHPRIGKYLGAQREEYFEKAIQKHSLKVLLLARFMVGVRGPVYLAAGVVRMSYIRFIVCDLLCASLVVGTFFSLSYYYGQDIYEFVRDAEKTFTLLALLALGVAYLWWSRRRQKQLDEELTQEPPEDWPDFHHEEEPQEARQPEEPTASESPAPQEKSA